MECSILPSGYFKICPSSRRVQKILRSRRICLAAVVLVTVANFYSKGELPTPATTEAEEHQLIKGVNGAKAWIHSERRLLQDLSSEWRAKDNPSYTVAISTFARDSLLPDSVYSFLTCPHVRDVQVIWHDPNRPVPAWLNANLTHPRIQVRCCEGLSSAEDIPTRLCAHGSHALVFISIV